MHSSATLPIVSVFGASTVVQGSDAWRAAEACGRLIAEIPLAVATGGYGGAMEAVSSGAAAAGGHVVGVSAPSVFPTREGVNRYVTEEMVQRSITERIHTLVNISAACIVLPGSLGTFSELVAAWNTAFVARFSNVEAKPVITVGEVWRRILNELAEQLAADRATITCVDSVEEAVRYVERSVALG